jgi:hypothetical protein
MLIPESRRSSVSHAFYLEGKDPNHLRIYLLSLGLGLLGIIKM